MKFRTYLAGLALATLVAPAAIAQETLPLSLDQAVKTALENNLGVQIQSYDYRILGETARGSYGLLDWNTTATLSKSKTEQATSDVTQSSDSESDVLNLGANHLFSTGAFFGVQWNNSKNTENSAAFEIPSFYQTSVGVQLTQPLLRDFGVDVTRRGINIARNNLGISREAFRNVLLETVNSVEIAYYDLVFAQRDLDVQKQSLDLAREQERITQIRIDVGADAPLDILEPQVSIAQREQDVLLAEAALRSAEDTVRRLLNLPLEEWDRPITTDASLEFQQMNIDVPASVEKAFENRPELKQAKLQQENQKIQQLFARNQVLPTLDLTGSYRYSGLDQNYSDALDQVTGSDFPGWQVQLQFGMPISNTQARADARRAELEFEQTVTNEAQTRQAIMVEVRQAARNIETSLKGIAATRAARDAAEKNLDAQRKRFDNGMSTNFDVLRVQNDLAGARSAELRALTSYQKSVAAFHRAVGDLLELRGIELQDPAQFDLPASRLEKVEWLNYGDQAK
ncbi:MAG: TolC family protein [Acidobacteria bacterium]|nr:TolC family protein [Acidobacteriota bacterium]